MSKIEDRSNTKAVVVGAGPVGSTAALALHKLGYKVEVFEAHDDPRQASNAQPRSINLALSARGIDTLTMLDPAIAERVGEDFVPMTARVVHDLKGRQTRVLYGLYGESIKSISRFTLSRKLLDELTRAGIKVHFQHKFSSQALDKDGEIRFETEGGLRRVKADFVVGCDGANSRVRAELGKLVDMDFSQEYIDHYYMEMRIPAAAGTGAVTSNGHVFAPDGLHIWPRGTFMFIALANRDGTFNGTLFAPKNMFAQLSSSDRFVEFFTKQFPDAARLFDRGVLASYFDNPRGKLINVKCAPFHYDDKVVLLGDAAHSMVPFYGQGLNAGLEDVRKLVGLLRQNQRGRAFELYSQQRKPEVDAISNLSMKNYIEMRESVSHRSFLLRRALETLLSRQLGDRWLTLYTMVAFRPDISYAEALRRSTRQDQVLKWATRGVSAALLLLLVSVARKLNLGSEHVVQALRALLAAVAAAYGWARPRVAARVSQLRR